MKQYKRRQTVVNAVQWFVDVEVPGVRNHPAVGGEHPALGTFITMHGQATMIDEGDWLIQEPDGVHWYPCKDEIFKTTYDPVDPEEEQGDATHHKAF